MWEEKISVNMTLLVTVHLAHSTPCTSFLLNKGAVVTVVKRKKSILENHYNFNISTSRGPLPFTQLKINVAKFLW